MVISREPFGTADDRINPVTTWQEHVVKACEITRANDNGIDVP
jgi:hypothetical protein